VFGCAIAVNDYRRSFVSAIFLSSAKRNVLGRTERVAEEHDGTVTARAEDARLAFGATGGVACEGLG
jgi:hypothetical protein